MSSERRSSQKTDLTRLLESLGERALHRRIDEPIERTYDEAAVPGATFRTATDLLESLAPFVAQIHHAATGEVESLTRKQAEAETLLILEASYVYEGSRGLYAAFLCHLDPTFDGLDGIQRAIVAEYKQRSRARYVEWVLVRWVDPLDWKARVELVRDVLDRLGPDLPDSLQQIAPERLVDELNPLISLLWESYALRADAIQDPTN